MSRTWIGLNVNIEKEGKAMFGFIDLGMKHFKDHSAAITDSWISNGYWAVRKDIVRMSASVRKLHFEEKEDLMVEDLIQKVLKGDGKEYVRTSLAYFGFVKDKFAIVFRGGDDIESIVLFDSEFVRGFNVFCLFGGAWCSSTENKMPYVYSRENPVFVVMPIRYDKKIIDDIKNLRETQVFRKDIWSEKGMQRDVLF